ncbi:hypothetical protein SEA_KABOCHA_103 [Gordonia phage Kabocha]|nr:hypothetical protein SEA_KABOCHA_103 [Gordonia phage Kabocha]WAA20078.1 hypothetical protein SEA_HANEM_101 [Gordonia phage Hanem]WNM67121.1 hypothetical protein SEA_SCHOMBER_100 [Gordonia Phage Schomber]
MLDRRIVCPVAPEGMALRQWNQIHRTFIKHQKPKEGPGYEWPCWVCGEIGMIGVDGFGNKGTLVRPRNMQHLECWESVDDETRRKWRRWDTRHVLFRRDRRKSQRSYDREAMRRRRELRDENERKRKSG